ncbi:cytochrome P450 [Streptomyces sp. NPDC002677]|uniref:cytochrome P450 n=1 Tax=Streptomyces sp. NPDC002677 TaxID=3154774 RepID=UPI00332835C8
MTTPLKDLVQVEDFDFYTDRQFEVYARMREEAPAFHYEPLDVHLLTRMDDVRHVSTHPELFSNTGGLTLNQLRMARDGALAAFERFNEPDGELVITKDPPRQKQLRGLMAPTLAPRYLDGFQEALDTFCRQLVDEVEPGSSFDFVERIAARLPLYVAAAILGVTEVDIPRMVTWVAALEDLTRVESVADLEGPGRRFDELKDFLRARIAAKRENPGTDMISMFFRSRLDGGDVPDAVVLAHVSTLMSNGGTTRLLLSSMAGHLADHPEETEAMRADPALLDAAMEEVLRLSPPARGFVRTLTADTTVADRELKAGDRVYMLYPAANRDPAHFTEPDRFDPARERANHASFGFGTHFCLGSGLARMEARALFRHLLDRFGEVRCTGPATRYPHVQLNGPATLPVSLHH